MSQTFGRAQFFKDDEGPDPESPAPWQTNRGTSEAASDGQFVSLPVKLSSTSGSPCTFSSPKWSSQGKQKAH